MANEGLKHFDYLNEYAADLEIDLGLSNLQSDIDYWRRTGMDHPEVALVGCRGVIEKAFKSLVSSFSDGHMRLVELIDCAEDEGIIDRSMALKCHEIRVKGNKGAHAHESVKAIDAQMVLDLLDDFLRWNVVRLQLVPASSSEVAAPDDPIFIVMTDEEAATMSRKAKLASTLSNDKEIEKKAQKVRREAVAYNESSKSSLKEMAELLLRAQEIGASVGADQKDEAERLTESLLAQCDANFEALKAERKPINKGVDEVNAEIEEVLSEHDFVKKLLKGDKKATIRQLDVMAFPRGSNAVTNILQIAGNAGTGKTLCLLAKIINEVNDDGQQSLFDERQKNALFICFNKRLAAYVRGILAGYDGDTTGIVVTHYDEFINQLVRDRPKAGYEYLREYARDVRYKRSTIIYGFDSQYSEYLQTAQEVVCERHPERASEYYLDSSDREGFDWLKDELRWIEERFSDDEDAEKRYPSAERVGRGTKRRPSADIRRVILEVRRELNRLLEANNRYTIEQATRRLQSSNSLPHYDAIAIDEVQDFSLASIRLLLKFRRSDRSRVYLSGDENQKIYQRDFTWKELDQGLKGHTITLQENKRNSVAIRNFSDRLLGTPSSYEEASRWVYVQDADDERVIELLKRLSELGRGETTVLISGRHDWYGMLRDAGVKYFDNRSESYSAPGLYLITEWMGKGLEFDNVVVDCANSVSDDEEEEKRLRYVHFTRARRRLYVRYQGTPPQLLSKYYADFLPLAKRGNL